MPAARVKEETVSGIVYRYLDREKNQITQPKNFGIRFRPFLHATFLLICCLGCENNKSVSPKVDFSEPRKKQEIDLSKIVFPDGFPREISLLKPTWVADQEDEDIEVGTITWNTSETVGAARDYYFEEFKKLGLNPIVLQPKDMLGENYIVRYFDKERKRSFNVAMGKQGPVSSVACFIYSQPSTEDDWKKPD